MPSGSHKISQDPTFRLIGFEKIWERGAALTSRLQACETEMLAGPENFAGLTRLSCHRFRSSEVRLWLGLIAYNLGNLWRRLFGSMVRRIDALAVATG